MLTFEQFVEDMSKMKGRELREAMNRSEYQAYMVKGIKGLLDNVYSKAALQATYTELVVEDTTDAALERYPSLGDPQMPQQVAEGQPFPVLSPGSSDNVNVTINKFGGIIEISTESEADDQSPGKQIGKQGMALGRKHVEFKDKTTYSILANNPVIYDSQNFFSDSHPGFTGGATRTNNKNILTAVTMSANALASVLGIIAKWEGADPNQDIDTLAEAIVCPVTLNGAANALTHADLLPFAAGAGPNGPAATLGGGMPNFYKGKLKVVASPRLDKISVINWYVKTTFPGLLYLKSKGLEVYQELPTAGKSFDQGLLRWRTEERFRIKPLNWRWGAQIT